MTKKILMCVMVLAISITMVVGATTAYFSDKETNNGNTFTAGTLDLLINGENDNLVLYNVEKMVPDNEGYKSYTLKNTGNVDGYLNITKITVTEKENGLTEPEWEAGDRTPNEGELGRFLRLFLYIDNDSEQNNGYSIGDEIIYDGRLNVIEPSYTFNRLIKAGEEIVIRCNVGFYEHADVNMAQSDQLTFGIEYALSQKPVNTTVPTAS